MSLTTMNDEGPVGAHIHLGPGGTHDTFWADESYPSLSSSILNIYEYPLGTKGLLQNEKELLPLQFCNFAKMCL